MENFEKLIEESKTKQNLATFVTKINKSLEFQEYLKQNTLFLDEKYKEITHLQRLYHLYFNENLVLFCPICDKPLKWNKNNKFYGKNKICRGFNYYKTCNEPYCRNKLNGISTKNSVLEKYGVVNISQTKHWKDSVKETCIEKYGTESYFQTIEFKEQAKETNLEKRGVEHHLQTKESMDILRKTNLERYGSEYVSQREQFKQKTKETNLEKYGVTSPLKSKKILNKVKKTNEKKYGVKWTCLTDQCQNNKYQQKEYKLPSGRIVKIQGYENKCLDELFKNGYKEEDICCTNKEIENEIGKIFYISKMAKKRYYPDIYIKSENKIIEVKSTYTYDCNKQINLLKQQACLEQGFNFEFKIY